MIDMCDVRVDTLGWDGKLVYMSMHHIPTGLNVELDNSEGMSHHKTRNILKWQLIKKLEDSKNEQ